MWRFMQVNPNTRWTCLLRHYIIALTSGTNEFRQILGFERFHKREHYRVPTATGVIGNTNYTRHKHYHFIHSSTILSQERDATAQRQLGTHLIIKRNELHFTVTQEIANRHKRIIENYLHYHRGSQTQHHLHEVGITRFKNDTDAKRNGILTKLISE